MRFCTILPRLYFLSFILAGGWLLFPGGNSPVGLHTFLLTSLIYKTLLLLKIRVVICGTCFSAALWLERCTEHASKISISVSAYAVFFCSTTFGN